MSRTCLFLLYCLCLIGSGAYAADDRHTDLVLVNGLVRTMDVAQPVAEAVCVKGGVITLVGSDAQARGCVGDATNVIDLNGATLFPGFTDAHTHPVGGGASLLDLSFTDQDDVTRIQKKLADYAAQQPGKQVIEGRGWSLGQFDKGNPHKSILDQVVSDRPVLLTDSNHHSMWLNSRALLAAGIDRNTADPVNGHIERDETGEPTGTLREAARNLALKLIPRPSLATLVRRLTAGIAYENAFGYTALIDAGTAPRHDAAWMQLAGEGHLNVLASLALQPVDLPLDLPMLAQQIAPSVDLLKKRRRHIEMSDQLSADMVKLYLDGGLESCTAAFVQPYADAGCGPGHTGEVNFPVDFLNPYVTALANEGFRIHVHAIGDRTSRVALDAIKKIPTGGRSSGHGISHLQFVHADDLARFRQLRVYASIQALWAFPYDDSMDPFIDSEIGEGLYPFGSLQAAGATLVSGSDWPVSSANPFYAIEVAVRRQDQSDSNGPRLLPDEAISVHDMIMALTVNGARYMGQLDVRGTITAGKRADLVLVSEDPYAVATEQLSEITIVKTIFAGRVVYEKTEGISAGHARP